jgi:hypothetical protein
MQLKRSRCWCGRGDLNPYAFRRRPLKTVCLPFHHFRDWQQAPGTVLGKYSKAGAVGNSLCKRSTGSPPAELPSRASLHESEWLPECDRDLGRKIFYIFQGSGILASLLSHPTTRSQSCRDIDRSKIAKRREDIDGADREIFTGRAGRSTQ